MVMGFGDIKIKAVLISCTQNTAVPRRYIGDNSQNSFFKNHRSTKIFLKHKQEKSAQWCVGFISCHQWKSFTQKSNGNVY